MGELLASAELDADAPLSVLFAHGQAIHSQLDSLPSSDPQALEQLKRGCQGLEQCQQLVERLGLFSSNEEKEDIPTVDFKYLMVPYYLGDLYQHITDKDRQQLVRAARIQLSIFVRKCDKLGLLPESEREAAKRDRPADPHVQRSEKVARFKKQRAAEARLKELLERKAKVRGGRKAAAASENREAEEELVEDEEEERQVWYLQIETALHKALDSLQMLLKEEELLKNAPPPDPQVQERLEQERQARAQMHKDAAAAVRREQAGGPSAGPRGRTFVSAPHACPHQPQPVYGSVSMALAATENSSDRERLRAEVFRPSHALPTMSIEEAVDYEVANMLKATEKAKEYAERQETDVRSDDEGVEEAAEYKARSWDDWKDENPRGAGNRALKNTR